MPINPKATVLLSTEASKDLQQLLPTMPILGTELNKFVQDVMKALRMTASGGDFTIRVYKIKEDDGGTIL